MNILLAIAGASALAMGAAGNNDRAAQPQPDNRQQAEAPEAREPRRICRMTVDSASRLNRSRVCLTADQWRARDAD